MTKQIRTWWIEKTDTAIDLAYLSRAILSAKINGDIIQVIALDDIRPLIEAASNPVVEEILNYGVPIGGEGFGLSIANKKCADIYKAFKKINKALEPFRELMGEK